MRMARVMTTTPGRRFKVMRDDDAAILQPGSQIRPVFGKRFGTVWNRMGLDRRKMTVWVPNLASYGTGLEAGGALRVLQLSPKNGTAPVCSGKRLAFWIFSASCQHTTMAPSSFTKRPSRRGNNGSLGVPSARLPED